MLAVYRQSAPSRKVGLYGSAFPVPIYTRSSCGSYEAYCQVAPPPYFHASGLVWFGQVSEPGSPGAGIVYLRHNCFPVCGSYASTKPRVVLSPPAIPEINTPFAMRGAMTPL